MDKKKNSLADSVAMTGKRHLINGEYDQGATENIRMLQIDGRSENVLPNPKLSFNLSETRSQCVRRIAPPVSGKVATIYDCQRTRC
jgi:hypothetical protein